MPNENHETYGGNDICTYTDEITTENSFTSEQIMSYVLSAGVVPWFTNTASVTTGRYSHESATGGANSNVPFYKESNSQILWYDDSALEMLPAENLYRYKHCVYLAKNNNSNKIATSLKIDNYKNVLTIDTRTYSNIQGNPVKFYSPIINTKYGSGNEWNDSVLTPSFLYKNLNDIIGGQSVGSTISVSRWWWGGENDTGNDLWGHDTYDRNLQYGTDMGGHEKIPWELNGIDPIRISEGGSNPTFPCRFDNDHLTWAFYGNNPLQLLIGTNNINDCLLLCAFCGLKFEYNGVTYKPLASNGVVYGYTDDMTKTSEWDNWHDIGDHVIPVTPPAPPAPDKQDNEIEMDLSHFATLNGFIQYYLMGISTVDDLADAMNRFDITLIGKDLLPNLISYKMFAIPSANFSTGTTRTIKIAGHEMKKVNDDPIQAPIVLDITPITLDTITIPHTYNDFRDYDPYTKIEMFVPFCGWFTLPPWCMGRSISGTMYVDLPNGTVKAVIKASQTVVAEIGGSCAVDVPFVAQSVGSKTAAVISNMANGLISTSDPTPQSFVSSSMGIATALNRNYTQCKGVMGDGSNVQGLNRVYIKVTRPAPTESLNGEISARYKHERGLPCGKFLTLASGDGLTQINDANITGTMTAREKQMIIDGFRHGLIL